MADKFDVAHEKLTQEILKQFKGKITGDTLDKVVGDNPENTIFVGKILPDTEDTNGNVNSSTATIASVGADFYISEDEIENAIIQVKPMVDFYYRAYPTLEEQQTAFLEKVNETRTEKFDDFESLLDVYKAGKETFDEISIPLIPVYKKVKIHKDNYSLEFSLKDILKDSNEYGYVDKKHVQNNNLQQYIEELQDQLVYDECFYKYQIREETVVRDILGNQEFADFITRSAKTDVPTRQHWDVYIFIKVKKISNRYLVSVSLVNDSVTFSDDVTKNSHSHKKDKRTIETLFNSGIEIIVNNASLVSTEMKYFVDDYKYDKEQFAVGQNCSVIVDKENNTIRTEHLPTFTQYRLITNDDLAVKFDDLIDNPIDTLNNILEKMKQEFSSWKSYRTEKSQTLSNEALNKMDKEIKEFEFEIKRFEFGIKVIRDYPIVKKGFVLMNKTFKNTSKKYSTWRLFQIVFIVSMLPDITACDENIMPPEERERTTLEDVALLYFPTGGGKTEAFLGVLVFNIFLDRFRGKSYGVTSILRYPLRLLSVQQVQRLANTLAQAELLRRDTEEIKNGEEFSLGYFVGDGVTPNDIKPDVAKQYKQYTKSQMDNNKVIEICPFCGEQTVHLRFNEDNYRLEHYCDNPNCPSGRALPLYIVDQEIYRYLPTAIISTVDKLAILGNNINFRNILSGATKRCPKHGFTSVNKCLVGRSSRDNCSVDADDFVDVDMYDPAPSLFIQDELHFIKESLGTYASHYESFINYFVKNISPSKRPIKVIGATATISSYENQIQQLYGGKDPVRFPCASPYVDKNFYSHINKDDVQRLILGYAPYGKSVINSVVYSMKYMREVVYDFVKNPKKVLDINGVQITSIEEAEKVLEDYWIFLEYNNVKRDGNNVDGALDTPINVELHKQGVPRFNTRKMTGDENFQDVREVLAQVENTNDVFEDVNMIIATSMISHGVDADRFNIMFFYGIPGSTAEYIQAYSRTGRRYSSIVVDLIRPSRETDQSYLKNFEKFHEYKDILVETVPINRWATKAIDSTLPGILAGVLFDIFDPELQYSVGSLFFMNNIKKAIVNGLLDKEIVKNHLKNAYGCIVDNQNNDLGNQYSEKINSFVEMFFEFVVDKAWENENIFSGFSAMDYRLMNSLRDTDKQLIIELE